MSWSESRSFISFEKKLLVPCSITMIISVICQVDIDYNINLIYCELRRISQMSMFLDESSLKILISSFVFSRIDYCNSLLCNVPNVLLDKLQRFQNQAARLVLRKNRREHITPMFLRLHWLPVNFRIRYKIALLCFKCTYHRGGSFLPYGTDCYLHAASAP